MSAQTVDELLSERAHVEPGLSSGFVTSVALHVVVAALVVLAPAMFPKDVPRIPTGHFIPLPPGGRGTPDAAPPAGPKTEQAAPAPPVTAPPAPPVTAPPPKVAKPPVDAPKKGVPELRDKPKRVKATPAPAPRSGSGSSQSAGGPSKAAGTTPAATGATSATPGLEFAPPGEGVPGGTDPMGDWYLASVQRKIWMIWLQQPKPEFSQPVAVLITILADGSVTDLRIAQSSGNRQVDFAAQRAVTAAAPFSPLPRHYATNRYTLQAIFRPVAR